MRIKGLAAAQVFYIIVLLIALLIAVVMIGKIKISKYYEEWINLTSCDGINITNVTVSHYQDRCIKTFLIIPTGEEKKTFYRIYLTLQPIGGGKCTVKINMTDLTHHKKMKFVEKNLFNVSGIDTIQLKSGYLTDFLGFCTGEKNYDWDNNIDINITITTKWGDTLANMTLHNVNFTSGTCNEC